MKKIISILILAAFCMSANAQSSRGLYGTIKSFTPFTGVMYNRSLVGSSTGIDTLRGVDTAYAYFAFGNTYFTTFNLQLVPYSYDSTTGTAILQGSDDNVTWQSITGLTSPCSSCVGASQTITNVKGTNHYIWNVAQMPFQYWRIRMVGSRSTDTTAVSAKAVYSY